MSARPKAMACARRGCGQSFVPRQPNQIYCSKRCGRIANGDWTEGHVGVVV